MGVDFGRTRPHPESVVIKRDSVEMVHTCKYLGVQLDDKLDTDALCRKGQICLYFLKRLTSFNICKKLLQIVQSYQSVVVSALLNTVVRWEGQPDICGRDRRLTCSCQS